MNWVYLYMRKSFHMQLFHEIFMIFFNVFLFIVVPKGFFPEQDTGLIIGTIQADQSISFQRMSGKLKQFIDLVQSDPAVATAVGTTGAGGSGSPRAPG